MTAITALLQPGLFSSFVESAASFRDRAEFGIKSKPLWSASHSPEVIHSGKRSWSLRVSRDGRRRFPKEDSTAAFTLL